MARQLGKLTALFVDRAKAPGKYGDGGGLYLDIDPRGAKGWSYRFRLNGRDREMGLGPTHTITLAEARQRAQDCRKLRLDGIDPIEHRKAQHAAARLDAAKANTFDECADAYIQAHRAAWRNAKHGEQWRATLRTYASPVIGKLSVAAVDTGLVLKILEPIWTTKTETASRVRGRIEAILDWAKVRQYREGENPARWRGHLDKLLPARFKVQKVEHHPALPYALAAEFMKELRAQEGISPRAMEFVVLTLARTSEAIGARWPEIDFTSKVWIVPGERMKSGREHRVPLCDRVVELLQELKKLSTDDDGYVFPGAKEGRPLSNMALLKLLARMGRQDITTHGFRSSFKDWAAEQTSFPNELSEAALAHVVSDETEAAYRRGDMLQRRRRLMEAWARYCETPQRAAGVSSLRRA